MEKMELKNAGRREFLRTAPVAMAAGLALADATVMSPRAEGQSAAATFQVFTYSADCGWDDSV